MVVLASMQPNRDTCCPTYGYLTALGSGSAIFMTAYHFDLQVVGERQSLTSIAMAPHVRLGPAQRSEL